MKVKDLIKNTEWYPGREYFYKNADRPIVSVLLPTFRRAKSGLFRLAVQSVLDQSLQNIELIIVDDASTDGTATQIAEFMEQDGRISCLRHPTNIGLPAVSEYEAFLKARGDYIAFQFDDDLFNPEALEKLLEYSQKNADKVCYGHVTMSVREPNSEEYEITIGRDLSLYNLRGGNVIPNNAVLLHRKVIEEIGFYDPHVVMTRQCDWDLWRRIGEIYELHYVDVTVGKVRGPATTDSLGKTYAIDCWASEEWMRLNRNDELTPENFREYDVFKRPKELSIYTRKVVSEMVSRHIISRSIFYQENTNQEVLHNTGSVLVLTASYDASISLCFDYLPKISKCNIRVVTVPEGFDLPELARASCVVITRHFYPFERWINAANLLGIPVYYYLDDNFIELNGQCETVSNCDFTLNSLREKIQSFAGVLLTSQALVNYFHRHLIHHNLFYFPPSYIGCPLRKIIKTDRMLTVAILGGSHRQDGMINHVLPALNRVSERGIKLHLVIFGVADDLSLQLRNRQSDGLKISNFKFELDWKRVLLKVAKYAPDILVHPPSNNSNNLYKTLNVALSAYITDSLLIVPANVPYDDIEFSDCAIQVHSPFEGSSWLNTMLRVLESRESWDKIKSNNARFCKSNFSGKENESVILKMIESSQTVGVLDVENRLRMLYLNLGSSFPSISKSSKFENESLKSSLLELSQIRKSLHNRRLINIVRSKNDLWPILSPSFEEVRKYVFQENIRKSGMFLEISESLHNRLYAEYAVSMKEGVLESYTVALASEGIHDGFVGIEIVSPSGEILSHVALSLSTLSLNLPVSFPLGNFKIDKGVYFIRLFVKSEWPVYVIEFVTYHYFGMVRRPITMFAQPIYRTN